MKLSSRLRVMRRSVRARVLAIVLIPSVAMLVLGVGTTGYLVKTGITARDWASSVQAIISPGIQLIKLVEDERRLTMLRLGGDAPDSTNLTQQRRAVDGALGQLSQTGQTMANLNPQALQGVNEAFAKVVAQLPGVRQRIDVGTISRASAYTFYNQFPDIIVTGLEQIAQTAPDPVTAADESTAGELFRAIEAMSRGNAVAAGAVASGGLTAEQLREYWGQIGASQAQLAQLVPQLTSQEQAQYQALVASGPWQRLSAMENTLINRGPRPSAAPDDRPLPMSMSDWQSATIQVTNGLLAIWGDYHNFAEEFAKASGQRTYVSSLLAGGLVLLIAMVAVLIAFRLSTKLIGRLKRLRAQTLELADNRLPWIVGRLRAGEQIDPDVDVPTLDYGVDEIGAVASAFNKAQRAAVLAATQEATTRTGMNAVFLNIAHRSQVVVRRQLEVLDEAERRQEDPAHLELLFQLDHLATRARRNAENLVILGGARPGRKWRNPVPLEEIARSAVSETEDFAGVSAVRLPDVSIGGGAVADLIHLLAELVDNATSFSPPGSKVEVRGNIVDKGVVVEVEDRGLGIPKAERQRLNAILRNPPDFEVMALAERMCLGLFVVAQLAARHGIAVTLTDSAYGGIHAIVLIPSALTTSGPGTGDTQQAVATVQAAGRPRGRAPKPSAERIVDEGVGSTLRWPEHEPPSAAPPQVSSAGPPNGRRPNKTIVVRDGQSKHSDGRNPLPRRHRQANMSPQLLADLTSNDDSTQQESPRGISPDRVRDTMSALLRGTQRGRDAPPKHEL